MKHFSRLLPLLAAGAMNAATFEGDWCSVTMPDAVKPGDTFDVVVTLKKEPGALKLATHLHWLKAGSGEFGGFLNWHPALDAKFGEPCRFTFKPELNPMTMLSVTPIVFLSPNGEFGQLTDQAAPGQIMVEITPEAAAEIEAAAKANARPPTVTFKKSAIVIHPTEGVYTTGDTFEVKVSYVLDPTDNWGAGTQLRLVPLGPWIDNPDGVVNKSRGHINVPGVYTQTIDVAPGRGEHTFSFKLEGTHQYNGLSWLAVFIGADGKDWPWNMRGGGVNITRSLPHYDLRVLSDGGLFTHAETPAVYITGDWGKFAGRRLELTLLDAGSQEVLKGSLVNGKWNGDAGAVVATPAFEGLKLEFPKLAKRGLFALLASDAAWGERHAYFATIPEIPAGPKSPFGTTNLRGEIPNRVAQKIGLSHNRHFVAWYNIEPLPGEWNLADLDAQINLNNAHGVSPWICLIEPAPWVMPADMHTTYFTPFPFDAAAWQRTAQKLSNHFKGRLWGFEWLNEIFPGNLTPTPVQTYVDFCRIGTAEVRKADPAMRVQIAGGLWPHNYRLDLLNAGLAAHADVLPIHYGNAAAIETALHDLRQRGIEHVTVGDNESASGASIWGMDPRQALPLSLDQCKWILRNFPDELVAGAEFVTYFGTSVDPTGSWSYLLDEHTPRPVIVSLALLNAKLRGAKPLGKFSKDGARFHLFERDGKAILIAASETDKPVNVNLRTGPRPLIITDYQGNESSLTGANQIVELNLNHMPVFIDDASLDTLKEYLILFIAPQTVVTETGSVNVLVPFTLRNPYDTPIEGHVEIAGAKLDFNLTLGQRLETSLAAPAPKGANNATLVLSKSPLVSNVYTPRVTTPFNLHIISPSSLGNLLQNGDFEQPGENLPAWHGDAVRHTPKIPNSPLPTPNSPEEIGAIPALPNNTLARFAPREGWQHLSQELEIPVPGETYLYTAWVWNHNMDAGSNLTITRDDGSVEHCYIPQVFGSGRNTPTWRFCAHRRDTGPNVRKIAFTPVALGPDGWALYDNIRVTRYQGTDFVAEATPAKTPPTLAAPFDAWRGACPIPLLCDNQVTALRGNAAWTPQASSAVAWFTYDKDALYLAVHVIDASHHANRTNDDTHLGDSLTIAINPTPQTPNSGAAFEWKISSASPGGGSGKHTLYRTPTRAGRLTPGQLARDSSVYTLGITRDETAKQTLYRVKIPWSEMDGVQPTPGAQFGCTIQLNDADAQGPVFSILWGGGLAPVFTPAAFGLITLVP